MFLTTILADVSSNNLLLGFMPESLGLLIFGSCLIAFAISLRWIFNRQKAKQSENKFDEKSAVKTFEGN